MSNFLENVQDDNVLGAGDISIPFLKILQQISPQCIEGSEEYIDGAKPGLFANSVTGEIYGKEIKIIPLYHEKVWTEWKPNRGGFVGKHIPGTINVNKDNFSEWKNVDNGNDIVETVNYYCILADKPEAGIHVLSLTSSGIKYAKAWNTQILSTRLDNGSRAPFFSSVWTLTTKLNKNDQGSWYTIGLGAVAAVKRERYITEEEYTTYLKDLLSDVKELTKQLDYSKTNDTPLLEASSVPSSDEVGY